MKPMRVLNLPDVPAYREHFNDIRQRHTPIDWHDICKTRVIAFKENKWGKEISEETQVNEIRDETVEKMNEHFCFLRSEQQVYQKIIIGNRIVYRLATIYTRIWGGFPRSMRK